MRLDRGLIRHGQRSAALWGFVHLHWWFGLEVRWDPQVRGSKVMVTLFDFDIGWLE